MSGEVQHKRSYRGGSRTGGKRTGAEKGLLSKNRWAWARVYFGQFVIWGDFVEDDEGNQTDEVADIKLIYPIPNRPPVSWNLTALTEEELISLKHLFDTAFTWALPIVKQRDQEAQDAFDNGDDSHSRIYRQVPQLVYRSGPVGEHDEGVHHGPSDDAGSLRADVDPDGPVRAVLDEVAQRDEGEGGTQDDGPTLDEPEGVREVGEVGE